MAAPETATVVGVEVGGGEVGVVRFGTVVRGTLEVGIVVEVDDVVVV